VNLFPHLDERWSTEKLARVLKLTGRRINQLVQDQVLPAPDHGGKHDPELAIPAYLDFALRRVELSSVKELHVRNLELDAQRKELELRQQAGELVDAMGVRLEAAKTGQRVRDTLLNIPSRISALLAAESAQDKVFAILKQEIDQALEGISTNGGGKHTAREKKT
jgi:hypothetical protein